MLHYADGEKRYILAPVNLKIGDKVESGPDADIQPGNSLPLRNIPLGTQIHNIELKIGKGGQVVRSAGASAQLMAKEDRYALIKMPSGEVRMVLLKGSGWADIQAHFMTVGGYAVLINLLAVWNYRKRN